MSATYYCGICEARYLTNHADYWCPGCAEGLCTTCNEQHSISIATRIHESIPIEHYNKLPALINDLTGICKDHEMELISYCPQHDQMCCQGCIISDHNKCTDFRPLEDVIPNSKNSALMYILQQQLSKMISFFEQGINEKKQNLHTLAKDKQDISDEIKQFRNQINFYLDKLERGIKTDLNDTHERLKLKIQNDIDQLSDNLRRVEELEYNLITIKEYGSDFYTFHCARDIENEITKWDKYCKSLSEIGYCDIASLRVNMHDMVNIDDNLIQISSIKSFGSIFVGNKVQKAVYRTSGEEPQCIIVAIHPLQGSIHDIQVKLLSTINVSGASMLGSTILRGCVVGQDCKRILTDRKKDRIVVLKNNNTLHMEITIGNKFYPNDLAVIDSQTIAVAGYRGIRVIDIESVETKLEINTSDKCFGITYHEGAIFWCQMSVGVLSVKLPDGDIFTVIPNDLLPDSCYIAIHDEKIYLTNYKDNSVLCSTLNGEARWKFKDSSILKNPTCLTIDNKMNVYTTSSISDSLVVISPDGSQGRQLLNSEDGLNQPWGICFNKNGCNLTIVNEGGTVLTYSIE